MANVRKIEANTAFVTITSKLRVAAYCCVSTDMWDPETQCAKVESLSDLKECLGCGIISEQRQGQLINSLNQVTAFIEKESTLSGVIKKLKKLKKYTSRNQESTIQVGYLSIS